MAHQVRIVALATSPSAKGPSPPLCRSVAASCVGSSSSLVLVAPSSALARVPVWPAVGAWRRKLGSWEALSPLCDYCLQKSSLLLAGGRRSRCRAKINRCFGLHDATPLRREPARPPAASPAARQHRPRITTDEATARRSRHRLVAAGLVQRESAAAKEGGSAIHPPKPRRGGAAGGSLAYDLVGGIEGHEKCRPLHCTMPVTFLHQQLSRRYYLPAALHLTRYSTRTTGRAKRLQAPTEPRSPLLAVLSTPIAGTRGRAGVIIGPQRTRRRPHCPAPTHRCHHTRRSTYPARRLGTSSR